MSIQEIFDTYDKDGDKEKLAQSLQEHFKTLINTPYVKPLTKREKRLKELREQGYPV